MSFKCSNCHKKVSQGMCPSKVITEIRWRSGVDEKGAEKKGWEIVKEIEVCNSCKEIVHSAAPERVEPSSTIIP